MVNGRNWCMIFAVALNYIWRYRNKGIFDNNSLLQLIDIANQILLQVDAISVSLQCQKSLVPQIVNPVTSSSIQWFPPPTNQFKLNCDPAVHTASRKPAAGGVLRDHTGLVLFSFVADIGCCSVLAAELWAIFLGLQLAWSRGFKEFIVESACWSLSLLRSVPILILVSCWSRTLRSLISKETFWVYL